MMTEARFEHLLNAYGTRWAAWPDDEREAGQAMLAETPRLQGLWSQASMLDHMLYSAVVASPSPSMREAAIAAAVSAGPGYRRRTGGKYMWAWLSGAGVAATAFAGAAFGVLIAYQANAPMRADSVLYQASLTATDDTEVLGFEMASLDVSGR